MELIIFFVVVTFIASLYMKRKFNVDPVDDPIDDMEHSSVESDKEWSSPPPFPTSYDSVEYANIEISNQDSNFTVINDEDGREGILDISNNKNNKIDFDLRKAVIYSAILEPKFKDL